MSCDRDLTVDEALADPVIGAALRADRVDPGQFAALLRTTARRLGSRRRAAPSAAAIARPPRPAAGDVCAW